MLHWHGDTYSLPAGAVHLARSARYEQQAFRVGPNAWGLQFHLEVDAAAIAGFASAFADEALDAPGGTAGLIDPSALDALVADRDRILDRFARIAATHAEQQTARS